MPIDPNTGQRLPYPGEPAFAALPPQAQQAIQALMMQGRMKPPGYGVGLNPGAGLRAGIQAGGPGPAGMGRFGPGLLGPPVGARPPVTAMPPTGQEIGDVRPPRLPGGPLGQLPGAQIQARAPGVPVGQSAMQQMLAARAPVQNLRPQMPQVPVGQYRHPQAGLY